MWIQLQMRVLVVDSGNFIHITNETKNVLTCGHKWSLCCWNYITGNVLLIPGTYFVLSFCSKMYFVRPDPATLYGFWRFQHPFHHNRYIRDFLQHHHHNFHHPLRKYRESWPLNKPCASQMASINPIGIWISILPYLTHSLCFGFLTLGVFFVFTSHYSLFTLKSYDP